MNGIDIKDEQFLELPDTDTKLLVILQNIRHIKEQCQCRIGRCKKDFLPRMTIKEKRLPISKFSFYFICSIGLFLAGAGIYRPHEFLNWIKIVIPFLWVQ